MNNTRRIVAEERKVKLLADFINNSPGFECILKNLRIISAGNGCCVAEYKVEPKASNVMGALHGGFASTLVDAVSSYALHAEQSAENRLKSSASVNMNMKPAKLGEEIIIDAKTMSVGGSIAYLKVDIANKRTGELLVRGLHTMYMFEENKSE